MPKSRSRRSRRRRSRRRRGGKHVAPNCPKATCMTSACRKRENERAAKNAALPAGTPCITAMSLTGAIDSKLGDMGATGILALVARYVRDLLKPDTKMQKTRQLMLDSFIYASLVATDWENKNKGKAPIQPIYGKHTYLDGQPAVTGGRDEEHKEGQAGGRRRRRSRRRRKSRRKSRKSRRKRRKSRRKRKRSRRRRRRR